jgi:tetratricopeptide (TPR) repeat protein
LSPGPRPPALYNRSCVARTIAAKDAHHSHPPTPTGNQQIVSGTHVQQVLLVIGGMGQPGRCLGPDDHCCEAALRCRKIKLQRVETRHCDSSLKTADQPSDRSAVVSGKPTATAYINRGIAYGHLGKAKEALTDYNAAQKLEPRNPAVYANRATLLSRAGYTEHALADYDRSLKLKADPAVYAMRGSVYHGAKDYAKAEADYLEALKRNPNEHSALNNLAWLKATCPDAEYRDGQSAVKLATKVCELTEWRVKAYVSTLAAANAEAGNFEKAVDVAERYSDENLKLYRNSKPVRDE